MKHSIGLVLPLALGIVLSAPAQTSPVPAAAPAAAAEAPAGPMKMAVINFQMAMAQTNDGQAKFAELQKKYAPKSEELKTLNTEVESMMKELQSPDSKLTDAERASRNKAIDEKKKKFTRLAEEARADSNKDFQEMFNGLAPKVYDVVEHYAQEHGYTVVLDSSQKQTSLVYSTPSLDITKAIIEAYNAKMASAAPPPAAGKAGQPSASPDAKPAPKAAVAPPAR